MKKKTVIPLLITTLVLTLIISFQNCSDIRLNTLSKPSINVCRDKYQIEAYRNTNSAVFTVHDLQANLLQIHENFHWTVLNENNEVIYERPSSSQLELTEAHLTAVGTCAPLKIKIDKLNCEEIPVEYEPFIWGDNCEEEPPESPTCEEDPTQPHCETVDNSCDNLPEGFFLNSERPFNTAVNENHLESGFGVEFGEEPLNYRMYFPFGSTNAFTRSNLQTGQPGERLGIGIQVLKFVAPNLGNKVVSFRIPHGEAGGIGPLPAFSISKKCGNFKDFTQENLLRCMIPYHQGMTNITTRTRDGREDCVLIPGETYYLNFALFNHAKYLQTGEIETDCAPRAADPLRPELLPAQLCPGSWCSPGSWFFPRVTSLPTDHYRFVCTSYKAIQMRVSSFND